MSTTFQKKIFYLDLIFQSERRAKKKKTVLYFLEMRLKNEKKSPGPTLTVIQVLYYIVATL